MAAGCSIVKFNCSNPDHAAEIHKHIKDAKLQADEFNDIFPWDDGCSNYHPQIIYIAKKLGSTRASTPIICGWLNLTLEENSTRGYISKLTARAGKDPTRAYKGVGTALIQSAEADAAALKLDFLYLRPLSNVVGFYEKVGFTKIPPADHFMFKIFKKKPSMAWLKEQKPELMTDENVLDEIMEEIEEYFGDDVNAMSELIKLLENEETKLEFLGVYAMKEDMKDVLNWVEQNTSGSPMSTSGGAGTKKKRPSKKTTTTKKKA